MKKKNENFKPDPPKKAMSAFFLYLRDKNEDQDIKKHFEGLRVTDRTR